MCRYIDKVNAKHHENNQLKDENLSLKLNQKNIVKKTIEIFQEMRLEKGDISPRSTTIAESIKNNPRSVIGHGL